MTKKKWPHRAAYALPTLLVGLLASGLAQAQSSTEANPSEGKISDASPLGKALIGHAVGHEIEAQTPRGTMRYRILNLS